jgi:PcfJ-like protein
MDINNYKKYAENFLANDQVIAWIEHTLANYLEKEKKDISQDQIEHIIDYLISSEAPQKNLTAMSYKDAQKNADKWVKAQMKKGEHIKETKKDTEIILDFKDGFKIVKLIGKNAYEREGHLMRHCVASYYGNDKEIYSLRDKDNMPHCTMEKNQQIKGKGNGNIHPNYIGYVVKFLEFIGMTVRDSEMAHLGYINVEKFKDDLAENTFYFNEKYVRDNIKLLKKNGKEFASLDLWEYKPIVTGEGKTIKINFELPEFIKLSFEYITSKVKKSNKIHEVKDSSAASNTGYKSAASNTGNSSAASNTGYSSAASNTGYSSAASNTGYSSAASNTGNSSAASNTGDSSAASNTGNSSAASNTGDSSAASNTGYKSAASNTGNSSAASNTGYSSAASNTGYKSAASNTGYKSAASNTGKSSAASNTGNSSAASNTGDSSAASNTGYKSAASNTGDYSAASNTGNSSAASNTGDYSNVSVGEGAIGIVVGFETKGKGMKGSWLVLTEAIKKEGITYIIDVKVEKVDGERIKEDTWYTLKKGKFIEIE